MTSDSRLQRGRRVVSVGLLTAAAAVVGLHFTLGESVVIGYVGGAITGAGMLSALVYVLGKVAVPPDERPAVAWPYLLLHVAKLPAAAAIGYVMIVLLEGDAVAFMAGYTHALIVLLVVYAGERPAAARPVPDADDPEAE